MNEMEKLGCIGCKIWEQSKPERTKKKPRNCETNQAHEHMAKNLQLAPSLVGSYCKKVLEQMIIKILKNGPKKWFIRSCVSITKKTTFETAPHLDNNLF